MHSLFLVNGALSIPVTYFDESGLHFFLNTGHPLFQGVSHDLSCCPIVLLPARVLWAIHCRLA